MTLVASAPPPPRAIPVLLPTATDIATATEIASMVASDSAMMEMLLAVEEAVELLM